MTNSIMESKIRIQIVILSIFFTMIFIFASIVLIIKSFEGIYFDLITLCFACIFISFSILSVIGIGNIAKYEILNDTLFIHKWFGLQISCIDLKNIEWYEIDTENIISKSLSIISNRRKFKLYSAGYPNYYLFKKKVTKYGKEISGRPERMYSLSILFLIIAVFLCIPFGLYELKIGFENQTKYDIKFINGVVSNSIKENNLSGDSGVTICLKEYPSIFFIIESNVLKITSKDVFRISNGDELVIGILSNQYEKKIAKTTELDFFDKTVNYSNIKVYNLKFKQTDLITKDLSNNYYQDKFSLVMGSIILCMGLICIVLSFIILRNLKEKAPVGNIVQAALLLGLITLSIKF